MATVHLPPALRAFAKGLAKHKVSAANIEELLDLLVDRYPEIKGRVLTDSKQVRRFVSIFLDDEDIRHLDGLKTKISDSSQVVILMAVAGG